jgi:hypothetical protein
MTKQGLVFGGAASGPRHGAFGESGLLPNQGIT